jgi:membrane associated rhomboid family serine protease
MRREEPNYAALGASGGVMGIIYAFILLAPEARLSFFFIPVGIPGWLFGILFSVISIVLTQLPRAEEARISHEGHLGGALAGGLFMLAILGNGNLVNSQLYFVLGGLLPIIGFLLVKLLLPKLLYRHLNR